MRHSCNSRQWNTICSGGHSHLVALVQASSQQLKLKSHQMMSAVVVQSQQCSKPICTDSKGCCSNSHMSRTLRCSPFSGQKTQQQAHLPHQMRVKTVPDLSRIEIVPSDIWIAYNNPLRKWQFRVSIQELSHTLKKLVWDGSFVNSASRFH
jgi:hypothetical protein